METKYYDVRLSEGQILLTKVALHELALQVKLDATRLRCCEVLAALLEARRQLVVEAEFQEVGP